MLQKLHINILLARTNDIRQFLLILLNVVLYLIMEFSNLHAYAHTCIREVLFIFTLMYLIHINLNNNDLAINRSVLNSSQVKPHIKVKWVTFFLNHMGHWVKSNRNSDSPAYIFENGNNGFRVFVNIRLSR